MSPLKNNRKGVALFNIDVLLCVRPIGLRSAAGNSYYIFSEKTFSYFLFSSFSSIVQIVCRFHHKMKNPAHNQGALHRENRENGKKNSKLRFRTTTFLANIAKAKLGRFKCLKQNKQGNQKAFMKILCKHFLNYLW